MFGALAYEETFRWNQTLGVTTGTPVGATTVNVDTGGGSAGVGDIIAYNVGDIVHSPRSRWTTV